MADNVTITNRKSTFDANANPDISTRAVEKSALKSQVVIVDYGGAGAENLTAPDFATEITLSALGTTLTELNAKVTAVNTQSLALDDTVILLRRIVKLLEASSNADIANRQRIVLDAITAGLTLSAITTVSTVSNLATQAGLDQRQFHDGARVAYNTGVRAGLVFS